MRALSLVALFLSCSAFAGTPGLRSETVVIPGALIRAGGPGGRASLPAATVQALCEKGVSTVYYLYPTVNFNTAGTYNCTFNGAPHTLVYKGASFMGKSVKPILQDAANAVSRGTGPVLEHCWNGWHASGEVAAYALIQLCNFSGDRAADYWAKNIADPRNLGSYGSVLKRIKNFVPFSDIRLSEQDRARVCP